MTPRRPTDQSITQQESAPKESMSIPKWILVVLWMLCFANRSPADHPVDPEALSQAEKTEIDSTVPTDAFESRLQQHSDRVLQSLRTKGVTQEAIQIQKKLLSDLRGLVDTSQQNNAKSTGKTEIDNPAQKNQEQNTPIDNSKDNSSGTTSGQAGKSGLQAETNPQSIEALINQSDLTDSVWGHLPPRERNNVIQTYSEAFLPGYAAQVQHYFQQLSKLRRPRIDPAGVIE